jgi:hypothetical protein
MGLLTLSASSRLGGGLPRARALDCLFSRRRNAIVAAAYNPYSRRGGYPHAKYRIGRRLSAVVATNLALMSIRLPPDGVEAGLLLVAQRAVEILQRRPFYFDRLEHRA